MCEGEPNLALAQPKWYCGGDEHKEQEALATDFYQELFTAKSES